METEVLDDVLEIAPVTELQARDLILKTRIGYDLHGFGSRILAGSQVSAKNI